MIITDINRCKCCMNYDAVVKATGICFSECRRVPYPDSNLMHFIGRDRFGSGEYKLDLRAITTIMGRSDQNRLVHEIMKAEDPEAILRSWLHYVEWLYEHEYDITSNPTRRRMQGLRTHLIGTLRKLEEKDAGREIE